MSGEHIIDLPGEKREREAIRRLLQVPYLPDRVFVPLGLGGCFSWYLLNIKMERLTSTMHGDVDILAGRLNWSDPKAFESLTLEEAKNNPESHPSWHSDLAALKLAESGGIKWPPSTDYLVGIEAKCAFFDDKTDVVKSQKSSFRKIHIQIEKLLKMGFNKVALLDIIANPPQYSEISGQAWLLALNQALMSIEKMTVLKGRIPESSPAGHWVWSVGSVEGGDETKRGAGAPICLRNANPNVLLQTDLQTQLRRREMERKLHSIFSKFSYPARFPIIFIDCKTCGYIHLINDAFCKSS